MIGRLSAVLFALALSACCFGGGGTASAPASGPAPIAAAPQPTATLAIGTPVLARWHDGAWSYLGVVVGTEDALVRVMYADGTTEALPASATMPDRLAPGLSVEAHQYGEGEFRPGTLTRRIGHAVAIEYADGTRMWTSAGLVRVRAESIPAVGVAVPEPPAAALGQPGSQVLAQFTDDHFYSAVVIDPAESGSPRVVYADGSGQEIAPERLRPDTLGPGAAVQARDGASQAVLDGTIVRRISHAVEIRLANGSTRWFALCDVRVPPG